MKPLSLSSKARKAPNFEEVWVRLRNKSQLQPCKPPQALLAGSQKDPQMVPRGSAPSSDLASWWVTAKHHGPGPIPSWGPTADPTQEVVAGTWKGGQAPAGGWLSLASLLQQLFLTLLQPPNSSVRPQSGGRSTHLWLRRGGHPQVLSESASLGRGHARLGPGAPSSAWVPVGSLVGDAGWAGKGDATPPAALPPPPGDKGLQSCRSNPRPPPLPHRNPKPPIFVFSFLLLGRFPAIKSFPGALQREGGHPIHLLNQSEQCWAGLAGGRGPPHPPGPGKGQETGRRDLG